MYELFRPLLKALAWFGAASMVIFQYNSAANYAKSHPPTSPDTRPGHALAQRIAVGQRIPVQSLGAGDWIRVCLVPAHLWSDVEWLTDVRRPGWSEDRDVVTLLLLGQHGRTLLVPFDREDMQIAPVKRPCVQASQFTRLVGDPSLWPRTPLLRIE